MSENTNAGGGEPKPLAVEAMAEHLLEEEGYQYTWPTHADDDGYRGGGFVLITPPDIQAELREKARRILIRADQIDRDPKIAALSAQSTGSAGVAAELVASVADVVSRLIIENPDKTKQAIQTPAKWGWFCGRIAESGISYEVGKQHLYALLDALAAAPTPPAGGGETVTIPPMTPDQVEYVRGLQASLQSTTQLDDKTLIGPAGPAAGFDGYGSQARPLAAEPPASPAGDLNSLSAGATQPTVNVGVLCGNNSDYVVLAVEPKGEPVRKMRLSIGGADVLLAELGGLLYGEPTPAAPRKGPSEEEMRDQIAAFIDGEASDARRLYEAQAPGHRWDQALRKADAILAYLTPADRGETQAVGDGWEPISTAPKDGTHIDVWVDGQRFVNVRWGQHDPYSVVPFGPEHWVGTSYYPRERGASIQYREPTHWRPLPKPPSPDQNRGEPDQGGEAR